MAKKIDRKLNGVDIVEKEFGDFIENGGTIGGDISLNNGKILNLQNANFDFCIQGENGSPVVLSTRSTDSVVGDLVLINNTSELCFRPTGSTGAGKVDIGNPTVPFKDIFLSGVSKSTNGYTKLPNEMILQWGISNGTMISSAANTDIKLTFPISFNTKPLVMIPHLSAYYTDGAWEIISGVDYGIRADIWDTTGFQIRYNRRDAGTRAGKYQIQWMAIGY